MKDAGEDRFRRSGTKKMLADEFANTVRVSRRSDLLPVLAVLGLLALAMSWVQPAFAGEETEDNAKEAAHHVATMEAAIAEEIPTFGLPPIVVRVKDGASITDKTVAFKADLLFDEIDIGRIEDSINVSRKLLPRIMDSVILGIEGKHIANLSDPTTMDQMVIQRANLVLKPYGVVVKALKMRYLEVN
jgi:hypothetical protein